MLRSNRGKEKREGLESSLSLALRVVLRRALFFRDLDATADDLASAEQWEAIRRTILPLCAEA